MVVHKRDRREENLFIRDSAVYNHYCLYVKKAFKEIRKMAAAFKIREVKCGEI